jgi:hypothetical protein
LLAALPVTYVLSPVLTGRLHRYAHERSLRPPGDIAGDVPVVGTPQQPEYLIATASVAGGKQAGQVPKGD